MRRRKAAGIDKIVAEVLKFGGEDLRETIFLMITACVQLETIPDEWEPGLIVPIYKHKGKKTDPAK